MVLGAPKPAKAKPPVYAQLTSAHDHVTGSVFWVGTALSLSLRTHIQGEDSRTKSTVYYE